MKKILIIMISIIVLQGCVNNSGDVVNDDNISEETTIEVSQGAYEYVEFEYDYPKMSEVPSEYKPDGYEYFEGEEDKIKQIISEELDSERAKLVLNDLSNSEISQLYRVNLLRILRNLYVEINNGYHVIKTTDELFKENDYIFNSESLVKIYMNKIYKLSDMDAFVFDKSERVKLHEYIISATNELISVYEKYEVDTKDSYKVYDSYILMGYMYEMLGDYENALEAYRNILEFEDEFETLEFTDDLDFRYYMVTMAAIRARNQDEANKYLKKLYEVSPDQGYYLDAVALYFLYFDKAEVALSTIKELEDNANVIYPTNASKERLKMLQIEIYDRLGYGDNIVEYAEELLRLEPDRFMWIIDKGYEEKYDIDLHEIKLYYSDKFIKLRDFEF